MNETPPAVRKESRSEMITRRLGLFLSHWGVDAAQYHWLLQASLKMDFRSSGSLWAKRGRSETKSALLTTVWFNLFFSGIMSLMFAFTARTFFFAVIMIGYSMAMLAMMVLVEFGLVVISPDDHLILAHRPISSRTFLAVRFSNLMFYVLVLGLSLNLAPAFSGLLCHGSRWFFPVAYLPVSMVVSLFVAAAVIAFYGFLMRWVNYEKFKDVLAYCQIALSFMFFFGYQLIPRLAGNMRGVNIKTLSRNWGVLFPSVWFAGLVELGLGHWSYEALLTGATALLVTFILIPGLLKAISLDYSENIGRMITASNKPAAVPTVRTNTNLVARLVQFFIKDKEERAFFCFFVTMLSRNRQLKLQLYPNFGIMIAMFVLAVVDHKNVSDPFSAHGNTGMATSFAGMAFVLLGSGLATVLPYSDEYAGAWIFQVAPVCRPATILKSVKKAILLFLFLPLFSLNVILFSFFWPMLHALEFGLCGALIGSIAFHLLLFQFRGFPFSRKLEKGTQSRRFTMLIIFPALIGVMVMLSMLLNRSQNVVWYTCGGFAVINLALGVWNNRSFAGKSLMAD